MTSFYSTQLFAEETKEKDRYGRTAGFFRLPDLEIISEKVKTSNPFWWEHYFSNNKPNSKISRLSYMFHFNGERSMIHVQLIGYTKLGQSIQLSRVTISTVDSNCGSVIISNLYSELHHCGLGSFLFAELMRYIQTAGYSFVLLNTAGSIQNELGTTFFQKKFGFLPFKNQIYVNTRSGNANVWYFKIMDGVSRIPYKELSSYRSPDEEDEDYSDEEDYEREDD